MILNTFKGCPAQLGGGQSGSSSSNAYTPASPSLYDLLSASGEESQFVDMGNPAVLQIIGQIGVSVWLNTIDASVLQGVVTKWNYGQSSGCSYAIMVTGGNVLWQVTNSGADAFGPLFASTSYPISNGTLYHVVGTWDGTNINLYVNGALVDSAPFAGPTIYLLSGDFFVGNMQIGAGAGPYSFGGTLDAVRAYNTAPDLSQVDEIYGGGLGLATAGTLSANLVGWWKFDEGSGSTAIDSSGSGNNGVISAPDYQTATILG